MLKPRAKISCSCFRRAERRASETHAMRAVAPRPLAAASRRRASDLARGPRARPAAAARPRAPRARAASAASAASAAGAVSAASARAGASSARGRVVVPARGRRPGRVPLRRDRVEPRGWRRRRWRRRRRAARRDERRRRRRRERVAVREEDPRRLPGRSRRVQRGRGAGGVPDVRAAAVRAVRGRVRGARAPRSALRAPLVRARASVVDRPSTRRDATRRARSTRSYPRDADATRLGRARPPAAAASAVAALSPSPTRRRRRCRRPTRPRPRGSDADPRSIDRSVARAIDRGGGGETASHTTPFAM